MCTHTKRIGITFTATLMLALAVGTATARNLSSSEQSLRVVFTPIVFNGEGLASVRCNVTLEGSFHYRTLAKVERSLGGLITKAIVGRPCARDTAWAFNGTERNEVLGNTTLPNSLPWHISYERFSGTLPNITGVTLLALGARYLARAETILGRVLCVFTTSAANGNSAAIATLSGGVVTGLSADNSRRIRSETAGCPEARFEGTGALTVLNGGGNLTIRLI